jgi:CDP-glycerol glycerophosphotransferase (TagB/SpsB family)
MKLVDSSIRRAGQYLIIQLIFKLLGQFLSLLSPKKKRVIIGAMNGNWYGDNSKYVHEYIGDFHQEFDMVWITRNKKVSNDLNRQGYKAVYMYTLEGLFYQYTSEWGFYTDSLYDLFLHPLLSYRKIKLIALRHGRSVKRVRFARKGHKISPREKAERLLETTLIYRAISTSEFTSDMQEDCLRIGRQKHSVTGYPRNDRLLCVDTKLLADLKRLIGSSDATTVLYAPSWRHGREVTKFFPFTDKNLEELNSILEAKNIFLMLRPHVAELMASPQLRNELSEINKAHSNIVLADHNLFPDVNSLLPLINGLISDYSALYHDFLLLDRPIGLVPYDYEDFEKQNGFLYDYFARAPGRVIKNQNNLCDFINEVESGNDSFYKNRLLLKKLIHRWTDNNSCSRVVEIIK